jgi:hypothetical protein
MTERLKILHCANFSHRKSGAAYYATDRKISNGFTRNGHMVVDFSYRDMARAHSPLKIKALGIKKMNQLLVTTVERMRPDVLVLGHTELVANATLRKIRATHPDIKIVMWFVDWIRKIKANQHFFSQRVALVDALFTSTDAALIQSIFTDSSQHAKIHFLHNICDSSIDTGRAFEQLRPHHDIVFVGRYDVIAMPSFACYARVCPASISVFMVSPLIRFFWGMIILRSWPHRPWPLITAATMRYRSTHPTE